MNEHAAASPWHRGEVAIQESVGMAGRMAELGPRVIRDHLTEQHRAFFPLLPFAVLGSVDGEGRPWATLREGEPGFLHAPDPFRLRVDGRREPNDPAEAGLEDGNGVALLGIELATRRRNRLNGTVERAGPEGFAIHVEQSFGNCPQYIHSRHEGPRVGESAARPRPVLSDGLDPAARRLVAAADTFFVASFVEDAGGRRQADVSHRGGRPGFVRVGADGGLTVPDYSGNRFFNTLGNLLANPRAGLVFPDFATGALLQMSGRTEIVLDPNEDERIDGAERFWRFLPERVVFRPRALGLRFVEHRAA
ncbi:UNVERIFIED_ORG: putative pyridoxine 5'-phosphate oxidase superfamily flavin-nucleotide-binding protein [Methylobacterium sp. SuP10 SLI 274]|uniref:pyridoxamine 5'-phosphate oxidase family protein n=1 Tax=Methylorubrum extorquens TaxID=408 RepID=UPI0020A023B3|nr:pyridoxamine 5'-phosphate oxidase family protein [Methylorubrum extorquens]MDF9862996.1 putative pyridoxine 5'-phosphate oxidase superfamily flavin-nucleotide-binding protein [Methylorubrum pseudosasae]MDH6636606.1 putative pyridoxine 5'-phosphate oxidase superfamily flavin-nucleotide-binding protein [Methylobacterium sp. SuP10 SLI 274]MDH6665786.1 putative pyridoxine 5'-phosphate oxidase superfamily flavin-nucleotide-binding protein [Methylorubrum zatmanii]MCP1557701.1 putative pyridoxine 5